MFRHLIGMLAMSGTYADIDEIRKREYQTNDRSLEMRPMYLQRVPTDKATEHWRTWQHVERVIRIFQTDDTWAGKRNKIKQLREVLRNGDGGGQAISGSLSNWQTTRIFRYFDSQNAWLDR